MFNSPMHYCKVCKQYVALDRSAEECAREHGCNVKSCPSADLFCEPAPAEEGTQPKQNQPVKP